MNVIQSLTASVVARVTVVAHVVLGRLERPASDRERGDVPGWVLITLMTAGLVTLLWALAGPKLSELFTSAMSSVTGPGKT
jgi:hypothetical protein